MAIPTQKPEYPIQYSRIKSKHLSMARKAYYISKKPPLYLTSLLAAFYHGEADTTFLRKKKWISNSFAFE